MKGVYSITSPSGKVYIGQSVNIAKRWSDYRHLRKANPNLLASLKEFGPEKHTFDIEISLPNGTAHELNLWECFFENIYRAAKVDLLNLRGCGFYGRHNAISIKKMKEAKIKRWKKAA